MNHSANPQGTAMSTSTPTPSPPARKPEEPGRLWSFLTFFLMAKGKPGELVVIGHSNLFYWWPVWLIGFIMAGVTYFADAHGVFAHGHPKLITVPTDTTVDWGPDKGPEKLTKPLKAVAVPGRTEPFVTKQSDETQLR